MYFTEIKKYFIIQITTRVILYIIQRVESIYIYIYHHYSLGQSLR